MNKVRIRILGVVTTLLMIFLIPSVVLAGWMAQTSGTGADLRSVCFASGASTGYAVGNSGVILKTVDGGLNWTRQSSGTKNALLSVHFPVDASTGYASGWSGTILKTTDGGVNWASLASGTSNGLWSVHFPVDATTGYVTGDTGRSSRLRTEG